MLSHQDLFLKQVRNINVRSDDVCVAQLCISDRRTCSRHDTRGETHINFVAKRGFLYVTEI